MATPIRMAHEALKNKFPDRKLTVVFQPHQLRRIVTERNEFITVLKNFDQIYLYDIYAAREKAEEYKNFEAFL